MTEKRLAALAKAREARKAKRQAREAAKKQELIEQDARFQKLHVQMVQLENKLDLLQQIPRDSNANLPQQGLPDEPTAAPTLSPIRHKGFSAIEQGALSF